MSLLIKNGHIFTAVDDYVADILVDEGKVRAIGIDLDAQADRTIEAAGKYVIPGGVDPHTHLEFPFGGTVASDDFRTGTIAAAYGGTTSIVDFAVQHRGHALSEALEEWHGKAEGKAAIDYGFHMIILDLPDSRLPELDDVRPFSPAPPLQGLWEVEQAVGLVSGFDRSPDEDECQRHGAPSSSQAAITVE